MSASKWNILQCGLRNKPKSIKIIAEASSKSIFDRIFAYPYFALDNVFFNKKKNVEKIMELQNVKKRNLNKNIHAVACAE